MYKITDSELLEELRKRFNENKKALHDLRIMTGKLESVNKKLQESEALKSNFLSNIRNEINNPLTSILCISKVLSEGEGKDVTDITSMSESIYREAFNLDFQLRNIFAAAELEAGEAFPSVSKVDMDMLVRGAVDLFMFRAKEKKISVVFESLGESGESPDFMTDPEKVQLAINNLLSNAVEYSHEGGRIEIKSWKKEGRLNISVKDYGIGINESEQQVIFDRFKQLDSGVSKSHLGHGLGASVSKAVIELLGGSITVSSGRNIGSIFILTVPEAEAGQEVDMYSGESNEFFFELEEEEEF